MHGSPELTHSAGFLATRVHTANTPELTTGTRQLRLINAHQYTQNSTHSRIRRMGEACGEASFHAVDYRLSTVRCHLLSVSCRLSVCQNAVAVSSSSNQ